jgi:hypothetical protein
MSQSLLDFLTSKPEYYVPTLKTLQHSLESTRDIRLKVQTLYLHTS